MIFAMFIVVFIKKKFSLLYCVVYIMVDVSLCKKEMGKKMSEQWNNSKSVRFEINR